MAEKKRKQVSVSMEAKFGALKRLERGESVNKIALDLNIGRSTVLGWKKKKSEIESWCLKRQCTESIAERKTMRSAEFEKVGETLYQWFRVHREKGTPISGPILQEKALQFYEQFKDEGEPGFTASNGWLSRWKQRYGIKLLSICGEKLSADPNNVSDFKTKLHEFIEKEGLSGDQIYNADETGLNFRMLPTKSLALRDEKAAPGFKRSKERVTILACSNATGEHKLKLALIGKAKKPRAFKTVRCTSDGNFELPVWYRNQSNAWMSEAIFKEWFFQQFVPEVEKFLKKKNLPRKALLILDNATTHPDVQYLQDKDIKAMFLPLNVTSLCQPMDQGALAALKRRYRRKLLSSLVLSLESGEELTAKLKKIDLLDVIGWVSQSWIELETITLIRSWRKLLDHAGNDLSRDDGINSENSDLIELMKKIPGCEESSSNDVNEWMDLDGASEPLGEDEIIAAVKGRDVEGDDSEEEEEEDHRQERKVSHSEAVKFIEGTLQYLEQQNATGMEILFLRRLRDQAARRRVETEKQSSITGFFKRLQ